MAAVGNISNIDMAIPDLTSSIGFPSCWFAMYLPAYSPRMTSHYLTSRFFHGQLPPGLFFFLLRTRRIGNVLFWATIFLYNAASSEHVQGEGESEPELTSENDMGEIQGAYQIKVITSALALLLSTRHPELTKINVQGHLIKSMSGITTRSKANSAPDKWTIMPLPTKILALLADALIEIQEQVHDAEDEGSDWEEIHGDIDSSKDLLSSAAAAPFGRSGYEHLEAMAKAYNKDDDYEDNPLNVADPLSENNLSNYLLDFLSKLCQNDGQLFDNLCQSLTQAPQDNIKIVLNR
ncbi:hypothetical protein F3Y22_tig00113725pilonHSYRG00407 [Hibiscus syriacus]|uniref:Uncharacterized protein n=1 Tax=Hibiscus syriacus TaxID=106335 RepID=A0A6A2XH61_HIBSY|nr:hypothetical protein F3Y22_tig00113725pilonHSYRG00407 [Hibiscus syriacus]